MVENKNAKRFRPRASIRMVNGQPLGEVQGRPIEVESHGLSQPISEVVIEKKVSIPEGKSSAPSEPENQSSSDRLLKVNWRMTLKLCYRRRHKCWPIK